MKSVVDTFVELGTRVKNGVPQATAQLATEYNSWFSEDEINRSLKAICEQMLQREKLEEWLAGYDFSSTKSSPVLIVMAGNIPLVGFFDLLCVLAAGHHAYIKLSHKDSILMEWIIGELQDINPSTPIYIYREGDCIDRVIATGGESATRHFETRYRGIDSLIRGSRHSVAVISESTTDRELALLSDDIYSYSGLGCRNVSMLFAPRGFNLERVVKPVRCNPKYRNNYLQTRALLMMNREQFFDNGVSCMRYNDSFATQLSELSIFEYDSVEQVEQWIAKHDSALQCVVANPSTLDHPRRCDFGQSQSPTLYDYADGVDTMLFLL